MTDAHARTHALTQTNKQTNKRTIQECFSLENQHLHLVRGNKYGEGGSVGMCIDCQCAVY